MTRDKQQFNLRIDVETRRLLEAIKARDGIPYAAQITQALRLWARQEKGVAARRRGVKHATA